MLAKRPFAFHLMAAAMASAGTAPLAGPSAPRPMTATNEAAFPSSVAGRRVEWFEHAMEPAWGCAKPAQIKPFAVVHPASGDREGAPLILELHSHGFNAQKLVKSLAVPGDHDIWKAPPEFYQLVPDCSPRPPQDSPDFWWC